MTPTQRSLKLMRDRGYSCDIVERWNPYARIRQDLWGFCDVLCLTPGQIVAVQTTSGANVSARLRKIAASPRIADVLSAGVRVVVHGWAKRGPRGKAKKWTCREEWLKPEDFEEIPS